MNQGKAMASCDISIIIVNYNTGDLAINCINSIREKTAGVTYEIIIVDNGSEDMSFQIKLGSTPDITVIKNPTNLGFGKANNIGADVASGKYLMMLNPDTILVNNALKIMFEFMEKPKNWNIAVCGGVLINLNGVPTVSSGKFPNGIKMVFESLPLINNILNFNRFGRDQDQFFFVDYVSGADFFIRKDIFKEIGGFDPRYIAYYEDADLCKRLFQQGYKAAILKEAKIIHLQSQSVPNPIKRKMIMYESSLQYLAKFHGRSPSFKYYCEVNKIKYKIYLTLLKKKYGRDEREMLNNMIALSSYYRQMQT